MIVESRRKLIKYIACLPIISTLGGLQNTQNNPLTKVILSIKRTRALNELGQRYLQSSKENYSRSQLEAMFTNHINFQDHMTDKQLSLFIIKNVKNDFKNNSIVDINGWQFSKTETYLAALSVLS